MRISNSFIHRIINSLIRLTHPISDFIRILFYYINRSIRTSTVNDDILNIQISLVNDGKNGLFNC
ncbi:hypothetical protein EH215_03804 [Phocaeicola vulgatus]|nr:hypothetical protein EH215_03804 [Phocaeicola vulgatus]